MRCRVAGGVLGTRGGCAWPQACQTSLVKASHRRASHLVEAAATEVDMPANCPRRTTEATCRPERRVAASTWASCLGNRASGVLSASRRVGAKYPRVCSNVRALDAGGKSPQSSTCGISERQERAAQSLRAALAAADRGNSALATSDSQTRRASRNGAPVPALASPADPPNQWEKKTKSYSCGAKTIRVGHPTA